MSSAMINIPPKEFGLPVRTVLKQIDDNTIAIVMNRKGRIIMGDGKKILESEEIQLILDNKYND